MEGRRSERERRRFVLVMGVVALAGSTFFYAGTLSQLTSAYNPNSIQADLVKEGALVTLDRWEVTLETCAGPDEGIGACELAPGPPKILESLPAVDALRSWKASTAPKATHATFRYLGAALPEAAKRWEHATIVVPRSVHNVLKMEMGGARVVSNGVGNDAVLHVGKGGVALDSLRLRLDVTGLPWFGPADFPVALVDARRASAYLSLTQRILFAGDLQSLIEVGLPVLFGAVALVLDHSPVFASTALYGAARAARSWVAAKVASGEWEATGNGALAAYSASSAACAVMLLAVGLWIAGARARIIAPLCVVFLLIGLAGFSELRSSPDALVAFDLRMDALSAAATALVLLAGLAAHARERRPATDLAASCVLLLGAAFHAWVNFEDIARLAQNEVRTPLDWRHSVLFPFLAVATLVEVGSVGRSMRAFAQRTAESALLEKEVELARDMQRRILPATRFRGVQWDWRVWFKPAVALGGDWVDIRAIEGEGEASGDELLVAAVVDVTGHGIGPALVTGVLCAQWGLWCKAIQKRRAVGETAGESELTQLAHSLHDALVALGRGDTCTGLFLVFDPRTRALHYVTCGHPGFLMQEGIETKISYLSTRSSWLGSPGGERAGQRPVFHARTTEVRPGPCLLALYTDGLVPTGSSVAGWLKELRRYAAAGDGNGALARSLVSQVRMNSRLFRAGHPEADDVTLVLVALK